MSIGKDVWVNTNSTSSNFKLMFLQMKKFLIAIILMLLFGDVLSQNNTVNGFMPDSLKKVVIIQPTGEMVDDLPEMIILSDTTKLYKTVIENINTSFVDEFLELYFLAQIYLKNNNKIDIIEPAYLALTENQGGFAKSGFSIKNGENHINKDNAAYIDITVDRATGNIAKLMSFSQLYPHEMGHVILHLLSPEDTIANNTKNVDMHFFSLVTDYSTAFNEGFAEHIENVSRIYEKNEDIKAGIFADIEKIRSSSQKYIDGFELDFIYPFRLGYYKASMLMWYQKFEDYKRYEHAINGDILFKNAAIELSNIEDQLTYRNSGVKLNKDELRNIVQLFATEGAISSFFTRLSNSDLLNHYMDSSFYRPFLYDTNTIIQSPKALFTPMQNEFIKYFMIMHNYVVFNNSSKSQLNDFIDGYIQTFPSEEETIKKIFKETFGFEYSNELPPPLWLLVKDHSHRLITFDPFDAITIPVYTFDLNASEVEDLQVIEGISRGDAEKIIQYRNENGLFTDLKQVKDIPDLSTEASDRIISSAYDAEYLKNLFNDYELELSIFKLIINPLLYIFSRAGIYFLIIFGMIYFFLINNEKPRLKKIMGLVVKYILLCVLLAVAGLSTVVFFQQSYLYFIYLSAFLILFVLIIYRKRKVERLRTLIFIGAMSLMVLISVI